MKHFLTFILHFSTITLCGQDFPPPTIKSESNTARNFSPKGWFVSDSVQGDLNNDRLEDVVFVLQKNDSLAVINKDGYDDKILPRILVIALQVKNGKYVLTETNRQMLIDKNFPPTYGSSFKAMKIENNILSLTFSLDYINGNFYFYAYRFAMQQNQFALIGADAEYVVRRNMNYEKASYNFLTRKWSWTTGTHSTDNDMPKVTENTEWFNLDLEQLKTLKSIGRPGTWEVTKGKRL